MTLAKIKHLLTLSVIPNFLNRDFIPVLAFYRTYIQKSNIYFKMVNKIKITKFEKREIRFSVDRYCRDLLIAGISKVRLLIISTVVPMFPNAQIITAVALDEP
jgi:hypothetical protein